MKRLILVLVAALTVLSISAIAEISQVHLGWSRNDVYRTMTVLWYAEGNSPHVVRYDVGSQPSGIGYEDWKDDSGTVLQPSTAPNGTPISTTPFAGTYYRAELTGLNPGTTYYFRIENMDTHEMTQEWSFRTIDLDQEIAFAFAGDSQRPYETPEGEFGQLLINPVSPSNWPFMRDFITQRVASADVDFMLALGDFVARGNKQEQWVNWFEAWQEYAVTDQGRMIPIVAVAGNHDMSAYPNVDASYGWFLGQFAVPDSGMGVPCYSLDFPNLHLTVLAATTQQVASDWVSAYAEAQQQIAWLEDDLASTLADWKLVAFHYNYLGSFAFCTGYPSDCYMGAWTQALQTFGVDVVFMGHTHNYTRSWPVILTNDGQCTPSACSADLMTDSEDGITYIVSGTWGGPTSIIQEGAPSAIRYWIAAAAAHPCVGFSRLEDEKLKIGVLDTAGTIIDTFTLPYTTWNFPTPDYTHRIP